MPDTQVDIPGVGLVSFPDSMTDAQRNAAATRLYQNARVGAGATSQAPQASVAAGDSVAPGSSAALGMAAAGKAVPMAAQGAMELATSPAVPRVAAAVGRVAGGIAPIVGGASAGGPVGALAGVGAAAKGSWAGGKAGYFTGKLAQQVASPVARGLEAVAPYAQALSSLGGIQGGLDLAQMAEPERRDIGLMGVGPAVRAGQIPMTPELVAMPVEKAVQALTDAGWPEARAKSYVTQMRKLMAR